MGIATSAHRLQIGIAIRERIIWPRVQEMVDWRIENVTTAEEGFWKLYKLNLLRGIIDSAEECREWSQEQHEEFANAYSTLGSRILRSHNKSVDASYDYEAAITRLKKEADRLLKEIEEMK